MLGQFIGTWLDQSGFHITITGDVLTMQVRFSDVNRGPFSGTQVALAPGAPAVITARFSDVNQAIKGTLQDDGLTILWENGTVWKKVSPSGSTFAGAYVLPVSKVSFQVTEQFTIEGATARINQLKDVIETDSAQQDPSALLADFLTHVGIKISLDDFARITTDDLVQGGLLLQVQPGNSSPPAAVIIVILIVLLMITAAQVANEVLPDGQ